MNFFFLLKLTFEMISMRPEVFLCDVQEETNGVEGLTGLERPLRGLMETNKTNGFGKANGSLTTNGGSANGGGMAAVDRDPLEEDLVLAPTPAGLQHQVTVETPTADATLPPTKAPVAVAPAAASVKSQQQQEDLDQEKRRKSGRIRSASFLQ